jgi:hypothetical protein
MARDGPVCLARCQALSEVGRRNLFNLLAHLPSHMALRGLPFEPHLAAHQACLDACAVLCLSACGARH